MLNLNPQYITDTAGKKMVILSAKEFETLMEALEDLEDVKIFDEAKKQDTGERIPMEEAFTTLEAKRKNKK